MIRSTPAPRWSVLPRKCTFGPKRASKALISCTGRLPFLSILATPSPRNEVLYAKKIKAGDNRTTKNAGKAETIHSLMNKISIPSEVVSTFKEIETNSRKNDSNSQWNNEGVFVLSETYILLNVFICISIDMISKAV